MWVDGKTRCKENSMDIRQSAGMVFQNPDNQIIGTVVEEDVDLVRRIWAFRQRDLGACRRKSESSWNDGSTVIILRINFPVDRSRELQLQVSWQCIRNALFWMSQLQCWIRMDEKKSSKQYRSLKTEECYSDSDHTLYGRSC